MGSICDLISINPYFFAWLTVGSPAIMLFFIQEQSELLWLSFHQCLLPRTHRYLFKTEHVAVPNVSCYLIHDSMRQIYFPLSQLSMEVQFSLAHHIQAMVKSERNRQIVCEGGLVSTLLAHCQSMLLAPNHPLHLPVTRILEKLSSQAITHSDFRWNILSKVQTHAFLYCIQDEECFGFSFLLFKFL